MKERPIIFSAEMIKAILAGRKTQTRRIIKLQPPCDGQNWQISTLVDTTARENLKHRGKQCWVVMDGLNEIDCNDRYFSPPYGYVGDRLWVRETWCHKWEDSGPVYNTEGNFDNTCVWYYATDDEPEAVDDDGWLKFNKNGCQASPWKPSIHMPHWASRITLEITNIRVERLQDISEEDAKAEGCESILENAGTIQARRGTVRRAFSILWDSIHGQSVWNLNPWVWVIEFKRVDL